MLCVNVVKSSIEGHTFGLTNIEHFPEDDLTLGKNRLLEADSFCGVKMTGCDWNKVVIKMVRK